MKNRFTSALLLWLCMCVTASSWAQTKKVVGHFHKKNGHTTKVVAKQKTATVNHDGRLFGKGKVALFNVAGPKKYTIRYGNRPRKTVGANDTTKSLQRKYNDAIISQLSKKQRKASSTVDFRTCSSTEQNSKSNMMRPAKSKSMP